MGKGVHQETIMSFDNTSHPSVKYCADKVNAKYIHGRPESELVPSRYALRVGEIDVMVVSDGVLPILAPVLARDRSGISSGASWAVCRVSPRRFAFRLQPSDRPLPGFIG